MSIVKSKDSAQSSAYAYGSGMLFNHGGTIVNGVSIRSIPTTTYFDLVNVADDGSRTIIDKDDAFGHDELIIMDNKRNKLIPTMNIKETSEKQEFSYEMWHYNSQLEKMRIRVTIEVIPLIGF